MEATATFSRDAELVHSKLTEIGGCVCFRELLYQLRLPRARVVEALIDLELAGRVEPTSWRAK